ncbi:uncharacterized protein LOC119394067 [Rhipicephalus sanguineus]|uniref:uncharacterized protein LOC119394067 n=1 Tax=Rhipicephalus sanguineus TaxID=34632 RepID=UPI0020C24C62|nr:uncharacterized protein LOC119394067 [Rhipicephalus sanguineus]
MSGFHIVEFRSEKSTYVVPTNWVTRRKRHVMCFWPPTDLQSEVDRLVRSMTPAEDDWPMYKARILGTKGTYERAKEFLPQACYTSNMDTEDSDTRKKGRRKRKRRDFSESDDDTCSSESSSSRGKFLPFLPVSSKAFFLLAC